MTRSKNRKSRDQNVLYFQVSGINDKSEDTCEKDIGTRLLMEKINNEFHCFL